MAPDAESVMAPVVLIMDDFTTAWDDAICAYGKFTGALQSDMIYIGTHRDDIKSLLTIGNMVFYNTHRFNWFERKMWKLLLGFDIENVEE